MLKRISCLAFAVCACQFAGAWTAIDLNPGPSPLLSVALGGMSGTQAGYVLVPNKYKHAVYWNLQSSWTDLHPAGFEWSEGHGADGESVVGYALSETTGHHEALLWYGSAANYVNLNPSGYHSSHAYCVRGGEQGGGAVPQNGFDFHAMIWHGSAGSAIDLNPTPYYLYDYSMVYGTDGAEQVGTVTMPSGYFHAGMWHGSAASWVDLNPSWADWSEAQDTAGGVQCGYTGITGSTEHATKWFGTAASAMDINPVGALESWATGVQNNTVVGTYRMPGGMNHAVVFGYRRVPHVDLHNFLPPGYTASQARAIDQYGNVIGFADDANGETHAIAWIP